MVWDTDRNDLGVVAQDISLAPSHRPISGEILAVRRRSGDGTGWTLSLLDVKSASLTDIWTETNLEAEATGAHYTAVWSPDGQRLAFLVDRDNRPSVILGIYSWAEQKVISRRDLNRQDVRFTELIWTPDGREVVIRNRGRKGLEFFNVNLEPTHFASYPEGARFYGLNVVGDKLLTYDERNHRLWRLDLKTEQWRCIF